jgi:hypothetical protein
VRWETHSWPAVGADAQDVINREIDPYDIFIGIMWSRFGTPTKRADSGTSEEFTRAYEYHNAYGRPYIMFYFRKTAFYPESQRELRQFGKVLAFRQKLQKSGVFVWEYDNPLTFERNLREHLIRQILEISTKSKKKATPKAPIKAREPLVFLSASRGDATRVKPIYDAIKAAGFKPWLDIENLLPGQDWVAAIQSALQQASVFLLFVSNNSVTRRGWLQRETDFAAEKFARSATGTHYVVPVRLDPVEPPEILRRYQWVDLFEPDGIERLISALRAFNARKAATRGASRRRSGLTPRSS